MLTSLIPLFVGPAVLLPIAVYAMLHRRVRAAGWYALLLVAIAHWSIAYAWELTAGELEFKVLVLKIKYLGVCAIPAIWIGFVLDFVGTEPHRIRRAVRAVGAVSAAMLALAWTDGWHHAFWGPVTVDTAGTFDLLIGRGPGFYVNIVFTYAALWAGIGILATRAFQSPYLYARRCGILIAATLLPWLGNLIFLMEADSVANIDPTPFLFACTGVGAVVAVFHYRMLDPIPALSDARVENLGDGVLVVDPQGRLADLNGAAQAILGRRSSELAGTPLDHALPGWTLSRLTSGGEDLTLTTAGGAGRTFETQAVAIQGGSDGPAGYMVLLHDVTERRAAAATIRESEQRYRQLVENAHDLIFTCDLDGHLRSINRAGLAATGFAREEIVGLSIPDLVTAETRPRFVELLQAAGDGGALAPIEIAITAKNGRRVPLEVAAWIQGADGPNRTIQAIGRDLTTRERYEDQLRQSQKMEAVGKLAAGIAHDFNNLLTAILGFTDIAERPLPADSASRPPLAQIRRSGQQAAALTRQLLAFARRQILQPVVLDLNSAISDLGTMLSRLLGEDVTICYSLAHDVRRVRVDLAQIQQVIVNLAVNARDAMPRGGELRIETTNVAIGATPQPAVSLPAGTYVVAVGVGHRRGHPRRRARAHLRAVLHDEGDGPGHRPGPGDGARHHQAERRRHPGADRAGPRHHVHDLPAGDRRAAAARRQRGARRRADRGARHRAARRGRRRGARVRARGAAQPRLAGRRGARPGRGAGDLHRRRRGVRRRGDRRRDARPVGRRARRPPRAAAAGGAGPLRLGLR